MDTNISRMLARHLETKAYRKIDEICMFCGDNLLDISGEKYKKILSSNFNDWHNRRFNSNYICSNCIACFDSKAMQGKSLRLYSCLITESELKILKRKDIFNAIIKNKETPFIFGVQYGSRRYWHFNAEINYNLDVFTIATEKYKLIINKGDFLSLYKKCKKLHEQRISKTEILTGNYKKYKYIEKFGINAFFELDNHIKKYRNTNLLEFTLFII
jgi:hypothetical protein